MTILRLLIRLFSSYALACAILIMMLILTFVGTIDQVDIGIYDAQQKYFNALVILPKLFDVIPVPLPGGRLLMSMLFLNIICGGIIRLKKKSAKIGIIIGHIGIALMLLSGLITYSFSDDGHLTLYENQESDVFQSYFEWEVVVIRQLENGSFKEHIYPLKQIKNRSSDELLTLTSDTLPFHLQIIRYIRNAVVRPKGPMFDVDVPVVDGYFAEERARAKEAEQNIPAVYINVVDNQSGVVEKGLLWGVQKFPLPLSVAGETYFVDLRPKRWKLPFTVVLDKFTRELHPRTGIAKVFMSEITKIEDGVEQSVKITMNEPLRHRGYTLFQASWGPGDARPGDRLFSTFAVVRNPADRWPLYACVIIGIGLFIQFSGRLVRYIKSQAAQKISRENESHENP